MTRLLQILAFQVFPSYRIRYEQKEAGQITKSVTLRNYNKKTEERQAKGIILKPTVKETEFPSLFKCNSERSIPFSNSSYFI
jgi:hypothetical protein